MMNLKGIVLAGGTGSRLFPLTKVTNKHLLPVGKSPMIWHPLWKLKQAGIDEILIVTGTEHMGDIVRCLGSGCDFGCRFTYKVQDQAGGIAQALGLAENFTGESSVCVILGDNIFEDNLSTHASEFMAQNGGARVMLKAVPDPHRFGVAQVEADRIVGIEEKPARPKSDYAVTGIYFYDRHVFEFIREQRPSGRGELEITDVNNAYIARDKLTYGVFTGWWSDAGTFPSLTQASHLAMQVEQPFPTVAR